MTQFDAIFAWLFFYLNKYWEVALKLKCFGLLGFFPDQFHTIAQTTFLYKKLRKRSTNYDCN